MYLHLILLFFIIAFALPFVSSLPSSSREDTNEIKTRGTDPEPQRRSPKIVLCAWSFDPNVFRLRPPYDAFCYAHNDVKPDWCPMTSYGPALLLIHDRTAIPKRMKERKYEERAKRIDDNSHWMHIAIIESRQWQLDLPRHWVQAIFRTFSR